jgi:hypothetical protein
MGHGFGTPGKPARGLAGGARARLRQIMSIYCGRAFSQDDIQAIQRLMEQYPSLKRTPLSRALCELWNWTKPDGGLKDMACRVALLRMAADGLITLPPSQTPNGRGRPNFPPTRVSDPQTPRLEPVNEIGPLSLHLVTDRSTSHLWNEYIQRYHYLGYSPLSGSQLRYNVFAGGQLVALLSFGASAWKLAQREHFIGWTEPQRSRNLQLVVNNARFLILPWIQSKGLASKILSMAARQLPQHWQARYGYRPVLLETFVESQRHRGTCYKAANWIHVGQTAGRGKKCPTHRQILPIKDIWLYPLRKDFISVLTQ